MINTNHKLSRINTKNIHKSTTYKKPKPNLIMITEIIFYNFLLCVCVCAKQIFPHQNSCQHVNNQKMYYDVDMNDVLVVNYSNGCLIVKTIRSPCPSSDQRRKVTKVLRRAGAPHTRRTMSLFVLYSKFLLILCCTTTTQQHQTKIFQHPIRRRTPIQTPTLCGFLRKINNTLVKFK